MVDLKRNITRALSDSQLNSAILINGGWGSGKTYFVLKELMPYLEKEKKYKVIYISLYGVVSLKDISRELFNKIYFNTKAAKESKKRNKKNEFYWETFKGNIKGIASAIMTKYTNFEFTLPKIENHWKYIANESVVLILDDLERSQIDLIELMGYINNFIDEYAIKTILVANELEIKNKYSNENLVRKYNVVKNFKDSSEYKDINEYKKKLKENSELIFDDFTSYDIIKEKVVGLTFEYKPDLRTIFTSLKREIISENDIEYVATKYMNLNYSNIRTFEFSQYLISIIYEKLTKKIVLIKNNEKIMKIIKQAIFNISIDIKDKRISINRSDESMFGYNILNILKEESTVKLEEVVRSFIQTSIMDVVKLENIVLDMDEKISRETKEKQNINEELMIFWLDKSDDDLIKRMNNSIDKISSYSVNIHQYFTLIENLFLFNKIFKGTEMMIDINHVVNKMKAKINSWDSIIRVNTPYIPIYSESFNNEHNKKISEFMDEIEVTRLEHNNTIKQSDNVSLNSTWIDRLRSLNENSSNDLKINKKSILGIQNSEIMKDWILKSTKEELIDFNRFVIQELYSFSNIKDYYSEDFAILELIVKALEEKNSENRKSDYILKYSIEKIVTEINKIIIRLKSE